uniref:Uncharacterized protein n=1 Tax=Amphimedon queenslandica TaxID=400682 RepID=A0A1X7VX77_AMPQE
MKKSREMKKSFRKSDTADTFKSIELIAGETGREGGGRSKSKRKTRDKISVLKESNKENEVFEPSADRKNLISLLTRGRLSHKVGLYNKARVSEPVTRSMSFLPLSTAGQDNAKVILSPSSYPRESESSTPSPPLSPEQHEHNMEVSPGLTSTKMKDVSLRILGGLKADRPIDEMEYVTRVKLELRKIMKQSNASMYDEMERYIMGDSRCEYPSPQSPISPSPPPLPPLPCPVKVVVSSPPKEESREKEMSSSGGEEYLSSAAGRYVSIESCNNPLLGSTSPNVNNPSTASLLTFHTDPSHLSHGHAHSSFLPTDPSHLTSDPLLSEHAHFYERGVPQRTTDFLDIVDDCMCVQIQGSVERPRMFPHKLY